VFKEELAFFCSSLSLELVLFLSYQLRSSLSIIQIVQSHFALAGKAKNIIRVEQYHLAFEHYRGGHPVPRAQSLYDGDLQINAN
jgi:hypothetical protein